MIVKNEAKVIERCLASVKKFIDYWVISDTGSNDGTQEIIKTFLQDIPGELHEKPWVNFAHNRNEVLHLSKGKGDYILLMDADEWLDFRSSFILPPLKKDVYGIIYRSADVEFQRALLLSSRLDWNWVGVIHEEPIPSQKASVGFLPGLVSVCTQEGNRSQDPEKFKKDLQMLEMALQKEPHNTRHVFYLAEAHLILNNLSEALSFYEQRASMGAPSQEVFWSMYQIGRLKERLGESPNSFIPSYSSAYQYRPSRVEPLFFIINHYLSLPCPYLAYLVAKEAIKIPAPSDAHFVEKWMYEWGVLLQFAKAAYLMRHLQEMKKACRELLSIPSLPANHRKDVRQMEKIA